MITKDEFMEVATEKIDKHFPKHECDERGAAIVLTAEILNFLLDEGVVKDVE